MPRALYMEYKKSSIKKANQRKFQFQSSIVLKSLKNGNKKKIKVIKGTEGNI